MRNLVAIAIADCPRRPQAAPTFFDRIQQGTFPNNVEIGILLPSKGHIGEILGGGRRANRHRWLAQLGIGVLNGVDQCDRDIAGRKGYTNLL